MKNKLVSMILLSLLTTIISFGQVRLGIRGGLNTSQLKSDDVILTDDYKITFPKETMLGYHFGLVGQVKLFNFFIQPEALYTMIRNNIDIYDLNSSDPDAAEETVQKINKLDFPVLVGFKSKVFKVGVGPVLTFLLSDDSDLREITEYDMKLNKATLGFQAGIGFDINKVAIDLKYEGNLSKFGDGINIGNNEKMAFDSRLSQFILSIGLFF